MSFPDTVEYSNRNSYHSLCQIPLLNLIIQESCTDKTMSKAYLMLIGSDKWEIERKKWKTKWSTDESEGLGYDFGGTRKERRLEWSRDAQRERLHRWMKAGPCTPELRVSHIFADVRRTKSFSLVPLFSTRKSCSVTVLMRNSRVKRFPTPNVADQSISVPYEALDNEFVRTYYMFLLFLSLTTDSIRFEQRGLVSYNVSYLET